MYYALFFIIFLITLFIILGVGFVKQNTTKDKVSAINNEITEKLISNGFNTSNPFVLKTNHCQENSGKLFFVDKAKQKIAAIDYDNEKVIISTFSEILDYEIYENESMSTTGGTVGGGFVGVFGADTNKDCKTLSLIIKFNNLQNPSVSYELVENTLFNVGLSKSSDAYKSIIKNLKQLTSFLDVIKENNKKN